MMMSEIARQPIKRIRLGFALLGLFLMVFGCNHFVVRVFSPLPKAKGIEPGENWIVFSALMNTWLVNETQGLFLLDVNSGEVKHWEVADELAPSDLAWSTKHGKLLFAGVHGREYGVYLLSPGGATSETLLIDHAQGGFDYALAPQHDQVAFSYRNQIYVQNLDGLGLRQLTDLESFAIQPSWSPDGQELAFTEYRESDRSYRILRVNANGASLTSLTEELAGNSTEPKWSPDGTMIAFRHTQPGQPFTPWVMKRDGSEARPVLDTSLFADRNRGVEDIAWAPDGQRLAFVAGLDAFCFSFLREEQECTESIYIVDLDGANLTRLTYRWQFQTHLIWMPGNAEDGIEASPP